MTKRTVFIATLFAVCSIFLSACQVTAPKAIDIKSPDGEDMRLSVQFPEYISEYVLLEESQEEFGNGIPCTSVRFKFLYDYK